MRQEDPQSPWGGVADAHCHLADLSDPSAALRDADTAAVTPILAVSMGPDDGARVLDLKASHPGLVRAGVGLHPSRVPSLTDAEIDSEIGLVEQRTDAADFVGEIGLDYKDAADEYQRSRQRAALERLLEIARRAGRPVNLHTRRADRELVELAAAFTARTGLPAILHWFTHSRRLAARCGDAGVYISVGPSIEIDPEQAAVAKGIAGEFLLVETDSPVVYGGAAASPAWARRVMLRLADVRGEDPGRLEESLARNMSRYLGGRAR